MALRIQRLDRQTSLVDASGKPTPAFIQWWQKAAETIENAVNNIVEILVRLGLVEVTADGALELAESAINDDGTIKTGKVTTNSIVADGVTERYFAQALSDVMLPDNVETEIVSLSVTKVIADSEVDIDVAVRLASSDDIQGELRVYRDAMLIDSFDPFMKGAGGTFRTVLTLPFTESNIPIATYLYKVTFEKQGGATTLTARSGSNLRIKEIKR